MELTHSQDDLFSAAGAAGSGPAKSVPVRYDLGVLLKDNPHFYRILGLHVANMGYIRLQLQADVVFFNQGHFRQFITIDCIKPVDYSIRPPNAAILMGGPLIEYHEKHELLENVSQMAPNTDDGEVWNPPVQFRLLSIDQSYVVAERFEMSILSDGVSRVVGWKPEQKQQKMEALKRALDSIEKYRLGASQKS